jgi:hypothetical protein
MPETATQDLLSEEDISQAFSELLDLATTVGNTSICDTLKLLYEVGPEEVQDSSKEELTRYLKGLQRKYNASTDDDHLSLIESVRIVWDTLDPDGQSKRKELRHQTNSIRELALFAVEDEYKEVNTFFRFYFPSDAIDTHTRLLVNDWIDFIQGTDLGQKAFPYLKDLAAAMRTAVDLHPEDGQSSD